jgi:tRNA isopentenyl-2-thiomethyl-A-37 hydroxylase MiaE
MHMTLETALKAYAGYEKRAMQFYRRLSDRFVDQTDASRLWRQMSDVEASHFALLTLAEDWVALAGKGESDLGGIEMTLNAAVNAVANLERAAESPLLTSGDAALLTLNWEEQELQRILALIPHLPEKASGQVRAGIVGEANQHYASLAELIKQVGREDLMDRVEALKTEIQTALVQQK